VKSKFSQNEETKVYAAWQLIRYVYKLHLPAGITITVILSYVNYMSKVALVIGQF